MILTEVSELVEGSGSETAWQETKKIILGTVKLVKTLKNTRDSPVSLINRPKETV